MKTVSIFELPSKHLSLSFTGIVRQAPPQWTTLTMRSRRLDGFVYVEQGIIRYTYGGGNEIVAKKHSLVYLPAGSSYQSEILEQPFSFVRLSYVIQDMDDGQQIRFFHEPTLFTDTAEEMESLFKAMFASSDRPERHFYNIALLSTFLDWTRHFLKHVQKSRIAPAISYLMGHYKEAVSVSSLAALSHLSEPQFFRVFREETGETPMEYRDRLRLTEAKSLLLTKEYSVSEVAELCGFESLYYFSRFFKKHEKKTPSEYQASSENS